MVAITENDQAHHNKYLAVGLKFEYGLLGRNLWVYACIRFPFLPVETHLHVLTHPEDIAEVES